MKNIIIIILLFLIIYKYFSQNRIESFTNIDEYSPEWNSIVLQYPNKCLNKMSDLTLKDFFITSAYRPYQSNNKISRKTLTSIIEAGARCLYIDVFSSDPDDRYNNHALPLVMNKNLEPDSVLAFGEFCDICKKYAWQGTQYPLIFYLNLDKSVEENTFVQFKLYYCLWNYYNNNLLGPKYSYSKVPLGNILIKDTLNKLIIITNKDVSLNKLKELVNGVIKPTSDNYKTFNQNMSSIDLAITVTIRDKMIKRNRNNFSIVVPENISNNSLFSVANSILPFNSGLDEPNLFSIPSVPIMNEYKFSIVFINYQLPSNERDEYLEFFKDSSLKLKFNPETDVVCPKPVVEIQPLIKEQEFDLTPLLFSS